MNQDRIVAHVPDPVTDAAQHLNGKTKGDGVEVNRGVKVRAGVRVRVKAQGHQDKSLALIEALLKPPESEHHMEGL